MRLRGFPLLFAVIGLSGCASWPAYYAIYDLEQECFTHFQHRFPPGVPAERCDVFTDLDAVFMDASGRCWIGTDCDVIDVPGYHEDPICHQLANSIIDWPEC